MRVVSMVIGVDIILINHAFQATKDYYSSISNIKAYELMSIYGIKYGIMRVRRERERALRSSRPPLHHKPQVTCVGAIL